MAALLFIEGAELENGITLPSIKAYAGDVLWVETENNLYSDVFVSLLLGISKPKKGIFKFFNTNVSYCDISEWLPQIKKVSSLCRSYAYSKGSQISACVNNVKSLLSGANAGYAFDMDMQNMAKSTRVMVSWALTMSVPALNIILNDPYYGMDKNTSLFVSSKIDDVAKDGSLVVIVSHEKPVAFSKHISFTMGKNK